MRLALEQAVLTAASADVPVGAIVVDADGEVAPSIVDPAAPDVR